ncbi:MAG: HAD family hydrolase [Clostridiales bacterium]|nr:HAD family hydrolase [Clostridiales bacterium]
MIKLIISDVDGTLLQGGRTSLTQEQLDLLEACIRQGILFAVASGRQYPSLQRLFEPIKDQMLFIAENGAIIMQDDKPIFSRAIDKDLGTEVIRKILSCKNHEVLLSGARTCYIRRGEGLLLPAEVERLGNIVTYVEDFDTVHDEWLKISAFLPDADAEREVAYYKSFWKEQLYVAVAGDQWVDFGRASKGTALRYLQRHLGITRDETMAFGDNFNDTEMFLASAHAYAMETAAADVKEQCGHQTGTVEEVLRQLVGRF